MRYFLTRREPEVTRILLIESGSRSLVEQILPHLRAAWGAEVPIDLVTCYAGLPAGFDPGAYVYRVTDYGSAEGRRELVRVLRGRNYSMAGMICSAEPIMTKWKWLLALRLPARFFILNENGDYFWVHRDNAAIVRQFFLVRSGLAGGDAIRTMARVLFFPFSVLFLLLYAFTAHAGRWLRMITAKKDAQPAKL